MTEQPDNIQAKIEFVDAAHNGSAVLYAEFLPSMDTVSVAVTLPAELLNHMDRLAENAVLSGNLPETMSIRDVLLTQGMRGVLNELAEMLAPPVEGA